MAAEARFEGDRDSGVWSPAIEEATARYFLLGVHHANDIRDEGAFAPHGFRLSAPVWTGNTAANQDAWM